MKFKVKALISFNDLEENKRRTVGEEFECSKKRADYLLENNAIEIIEEKEEELKVDIINKESDSKEEKKEEIKKSAKPFKKRKAGKK